MKYYKPLFPFLLGWVLLLLTHSLASISLVNGIIQLVLFAMVVCIPIWKTGKLSYVDIGWPWGLVCIGLITILLGNGYSIRVWAIGGIYLFIGLRMGLAALMYWQKGYLDKELPRYQYQRIRWERQGKRNKVCDIGLWQYTRHPNYFAEWMVWNALIIATIPSWLALKDQESILVWILLGLGLLFISRLMYATLVYFTGAKPSEYYSMQKRPDYEAYTKRVNMFFPGPPKGQKD